MDWEFGVSRCKLLHIRMDKQQGSMVQHRKLYQYSVTNHSGKEYEKDCIYINNQITLAVAENSTTL